MVQLYYTKNIDLKNLTHEEAVVALSFNPMIRDRKRMGLGITRPDWSGFHYFDKNHDYCILTKDGVIMTEPEDIYDIDKDDWMVVEMTETAVDILYNGGSIDYGISRINAPTGDNYNSVNSIKIDEVFGNVPYKYALLIESDDKKSVDKCAIYKDNNWSLCRKEDITTIGMSKFQVESLTKSEFVDLITRFGYSKFIIEVHGLKSTVDKSVNGRVNKITISKDLKL